MQLFSSVLTLYHVTVKYLLVNTGRKTRSTKNFDLAANPHSIAYYRKCANKLNLLMYIQQSSRVSGRRHASAIAFERSIAYQL
jgi:hypothetical protein